jgi:hypothetical protein
MFFAAAPAATVSIPVLMSAVLLCCLDVAAAAGRAFLLSSGFIRQFPRVPSILTLEHFHTGNLNCPAFDLQCLAPDECFRHLVVRRFDNPPKRLARNAHLFGGLILIEALKVGQSDGLELVKA